MPIALITGITGQDGSYLTELLLEKGYEVHGVVRRSSQAALDRIDHLTRDTNIFGKTLFLHHAELEDATALRRMFTAVQPHEVYHLAGQSRVELSFELPESTCRQTAMATLGLLEIVRGLPQPPKFLNVGSSELFGLTSQMPQNETTPIEPASPYGVAKAFAVNMTRVYRESMGLFACSAICYNHESPRRGESFVTRKITRTAAAIKLGQQSKLTLGNLDATRDWGFAREYVEAMWLMLQQESADDFILATGVSTFVRDFVRLAFERVGLDWKSHVEVDPKLLRKVDPVRFVGDASKAKAILGWVPSTSVQELVAMMVDADVERLSD